MARTLLYVVLASGLAATACNNNNPFLTQPTDTSTPAVLTTDTFDGSVTVNGGTTNPFIVNRAGTVTAVVSALAPSNANVGFRRAGHLNMRSGKKGGASYPAMR